MKRDKIHSILLRLLGRLQQKLNRIPAGRMKIYCIVGILSCVAGSTAMLTIAFRLRENNYTWQPMQFPYAAAPPVKSPLSTNDSTGRVVFRAWLDSLKADTARGNIYERIRLERPGLWDTIRQLEKFYSK